MAFGLRAKGASMKVTEVLTQISLGMGVGITSNAIVEVSHVPVLNDSGTFGNSKTSNFRLFVDGICIAGIVAGIVDLATGKGVLTFSRSMIFYLVGILVGVYFYDNTLATMLHIRNLNPYHELAKRVPAVIPGGVGSHLPFINRGAPSAPMIARPNKKTLPNQPLI